MNNAFTLKETLVVLLIVMILSSFSIPREQDRGSVLERADARLFVSGKTGCRDW